MINLLIVAAGGALGAAGRYAVGLLPVKSDFPLLSLLVNAAGAVIIGFLAGLFARGGLTDRRLLFWKTGVCGGFTTFSAFSLEAVQLFEKGRQPLHTAEPAALSRWCAGGAGAQPPVREIKAFGAS